VGRNLRHPGRSLQEMLVDAGLSTITKVTRRPGRHRRTVWLVVEITRQSPCDNVRIAHGTPESFRLATKVGALRSARLASEIVLFHLSDSVYKCPYTRDISRRNTQRADGAVRLYTVSLCQEKSVSVAAFCFLAT
jgi:hypothetical protein